MTRKTISRPFVKRNYSQSGVFCLKCVFHAVEKKLNNTLKVKVQFFSACDEFSICKTSGYFFFLIFVNNGFGKFAFFRLIYQILTTVNHKTYPGYLSKMYCQTAQLGGQAN